MSDRKTPLAKGTYAVFARRGGGYRLYVRAEDQEQDEYMDIPPQLVMLARMRAKRGATGPVAMLASLGDFAED